jgi:hypothetical protein
MRSLLVEITVVHVFRKLAGTSFDGGSLVRRAGELKGERSDKVRLLPLVQTKYTQCVVTEFKVTASETPTKFIANRECCSASK